jgi:hypothetical protein
MGTAKVREMNNSANKSWAIDFMRSDTVIIW